MSKTLLNRLAMFEVIDLEGPLTITELSRRCGIDVTVVSRTVAACEPDGWLVRVDGRVALGPRCTLLGHGGPVAAVIQQAETLVHAVAGVTGVLTHAYGLVGRDAVLVATAEGAHSTVPPGLSSRAPLHAIAAGRAIASQLDSAALDASLPPEPFPDAATVFVTLTTGAPAALFPGSRRADSAHRGPELPRNRAELDHELAAIRRDGIAADLGALHPGLHCLAVPWPQAVLPASLACLGSPDQLDSKAALVRRALAAAASPGASARDVVVAAADVMAEPGG